MMWSLDRWLKGKSVYFQIEFDMLFRAIPYFVGYFLILWNYAGINPVFPSNRWEALFMLAQIASPGVIVASVGSYIIEIWRLKIKELGVRYKPLSVGIWWILFSIPLFKKIPEPRYAPTGRSSGQAPLRIAITRLSSTFKELRRYRQPFLFIIAFWFYNDGIGTIIKMATAYGDEIGIGMMDLIGALMLTQVIGAPFSLLFGHLADRISSKKAILLGLGVYTIIAIGAFFMTEAIHFWLLAFMVGLVQGGTQALSRSLYGSMIPRNKSAEFFSFYSISGKFAGFMGPAIFALVSQLVGSSRLGILSLIFFFLVGALILVKVDVEKGKLSVQTK